MTDIGWKFPPTGGGRVDGYNDPGMSHFDGSPLASLARETIQNSLDARQLGIVQVSFELARIDDPDVIGKNELAFAVQRCLEEVGDEVKARSELAKAAEALSGDALTFLRVRDYQTTGLHGKHWHALVKQQGASEKDTRSAGGSFGIGKYAPFVVSPLRTVFYWSRFEFDGATVEQCQGKAVLMSHRDADGEETQGTGFFGLTDGCREVSGDAIPRQIAVKEAGDSNGTSLWIAGFEGGAGWQLRVASSVIENFFSAIADGHLEVTLETNATMDKHGLMGIDESNLDTWFDLLVDDDAEERDEDDALAEARAFREVLQDDDATLSEREDPDLGHCVLYIKVADGLPGKVALIRGTGMLITSDQRGAKRRAGLQKFPGLRDFAAVCRFESEKGNELLRQMENPQHNQFEPDRLPEELRDKGRRALNRVAQWIRAEIRKLASPAVSEDFTELTELAQLLPELEPDDQFGSGRPGDRERGFGAAASVIELRPRRRTAAPTLDDDSGENTGDEEEDGDEGGAGEGENQGIGGTGFGAGAGTGAGGSGSRGGGRTSEVFAIRDVRVLPEGDDAHSCKLAFTPLQSASEVGIRISEAGDSTPIDRSDLQVQADGGEFVPMIDFRMDLSGERRSEVTIRGDAPVNARAWRVQAVRWAEAATSERSGQ